MPLTPFQKDVLAVLADEQLDMPIGVAFVDEKAEPGWIRSNPAPRVHYPSLRGCWPTIHPV